MAERELDSKVLTLLGKIGESDQLVYTDGVHYYAVDAATGAVYQTTSASEAIQRAIDAVEAQGGGSVFIKPGLYELKIARTVYDPIWDVNFYVCLVIPSNVKVILEHGAILKPVENPPVGENEAVFMNEDPTNGNENIRIEGGEMDGNLDVVTEYCVGITLRNVKNVEIRNMKIHDLSGYAVDPELAERIRICDCQIYGIDAIAINLYWGLAEYDTKELIVRGNFIHDNAVFADGIYVEGCERVIVEGNILRNNGDGIVFAYSRGVIQGNECIENGEIGIYLYNVDHATVTGNRLVDNGTKGIFLSANTRDVCVTGNRISGSPYGIQEENSDYNLIDSNTCRGNTTAIETVGLNTIVGDNVS